MQIETSKLNKDFLEEKKIFAGLFVKEREYWMDKFSGELVLGHLPYDYQTKGIEYDNFDSVGFNIEGNLMSQLEKLIGGSNPKLHIALTAALTLLIFKYTYNTDVIIGTPIDKQEVEAEFTNTMLAIRNQISDTMTFKELLLQVRQNIIEAIENQNFPIEALLSQLKLKNFQLFDTALLVENIHDRRYIKDVNPNIIFSFLRIENGINGNVFYNSRLFEKSTIEQFTVHFIRLLGKALVNLNAPLSSINILCEDEKKRLIYDFNNTASDYPWNKKIHELFEEHAIKTPNNTAVEFDDKKLSYRELNEKKNRLAELLRMKGIMKGSIIGIIASRSLEIITAILGILKAGGAYLPIDTEYSEDRKKYILDDSGIALLLTESTLPLYLNRQVETIDIAHWNIEVKDVNANGFENIHFALTTPSDLAYIIYTSGSTGKPKGVMIEHRGLVNYVWWAARSYVKNRNYFSANFPFYTSVSFDLTVTSIFIPLITGGKIIIYDDEKEVLIEKILKENKVDIVKLTPTHLKLIRNNNDRAYLNINCFIVGGEELETRLAKDIHNDFAGNVDIFNEYGPTEATVGCMIYRFNPKVDNRIAVPIGIPSDNTRIYILDKSQEPVPVGVTGEINISGDGVARGYLNRPELTAERFTKNPFELGQRLYRTGDLGHFTTDGNIEFQGRIDNQVKIRGYRIELGEIESKLIQHKEIKDALVTAKVNEDGDKFLCAYIVLSRELDLTEIREYVSRELPDYMIPSYFVNLEKIPLNPHGKVDREALPDPLEFSMEDNTPYIPPRDIIEKLIVEVWEKVLGRKNISINENFFLLGGDSIKSIQIISRMNSAGFKLEMKDLFKYPVISALAPYVKKLKHIPDQVPVIGVIPLTPIQKWFFEKHHIDIHHFNQSVMFYSRNGLNEETINSIFTKIQKHHDVLRMTYKEENGKMIQINNGLDYPFSLEIHDLRNQGNSAAELEAKATKIQASIDLEKGPLMKLGLFRLDDGDRLLAAIHHLVIDAVSWRILFEDIETLYQQYKKGESLTLSLKADSFKVWAEKLSDYANSETFLKEKAYWAELESTKLPFIEKDFDEPDNYRKDSTQLSFILDEQATDNLLTKVNYAFGTDINDILLTVLALGIKKTWKHNHALISLEGHGREEIIPDVDISRTLGWFTSAYPLVIDISYENDLGHQIKEVKEAIRRVPNKGIGYGILKYLTNENHKKDIRFQLNPQFGFNYLGQFDAEIRQMSFEIAKESAGNGTSRECERDLDFDILGIIANNRLGITVTYNKKHYKPETINVLVNHIQSELRNIILFCCSKENTERTPSDFTYKRLSIRTIDRLMNEYKDVEDIYTLTPMQEGMLFHALVNDSSYSYFEQMSYHLQGELNIYLVEKSLNELFKRYDILRTAFLYKDIERPVQLVLKDRVIDFYYEDISTLGERDEKYNYIREFKAKDKKRGFDLAKESLMRVSIIEVNRLEYEFIWSFHHILMDGWCVGILNTEFFEIYNSYLENRPYRLPVLKLYRTYIQWLEKQDKDVSATYWKNYLDSYEEQTGISRTKLSNEGNKYRNETVSIVFDIEITARLNKLAAGSHVTLNTVTQALWGIILAKYNGKEDVVFGAVVSGRPSELEGVESMVGLFINTIPVRICFREKMKFYELLQDIQKEALASEPYHYYPLAEIQSRTPLKQNLIDHIFIFENYPIAEQIEIYRREKNKNAATSIKLDNLEAFEQTNYDFNVILKGSDLLKITFKYNSNVYEKDVVERIAKHFSIVVDQVIENQELEVRDLTLLSEDEKNQLLYEFNDTAVKYPKDKIIHQLFEEQTSKTPDYIAIVGNADVEEKKRRREEEKNGGVETLRATSLQIQMSYRQLNEQSDRLADELIEKGVQADIIVAIMMERSIEMIIGIMGILKAGGAYLPIEPGYPRERIDYMLKDSGAKMLIRRAEERKSGKAEKTIFIDVLEFSNLLASSLPRLLASNSSNLAYIIYTSGSTGKPKGVMVEHRNVVNLAISQKNRFAINEKDRILQFSSICFDASVEQIFIALFSGAVLFLIDKNTLLDNIKFEELISSRLITHLHAVPSFLNNTSLKEGYQLKRIISGGDVCPPGLARKYGAYCDFYNEYGPTETTVTSIEMQYADINEVLDYLPIGKPIANTFVYLFDKWVKPVPFGVVGELYIGGSGVARGYLNKPELTAEKFIHFHHSSFDIPRIQHSKLYRTGDLARWLPDGSIEFLGRIDHQVKIRGFRIETGEIEYQLLSQDGIIEAAVIIKTETSENYLCAYFTSDKKIEIWELRDNLAKTLPNYMIPSYFNQIESMPITIRGKIDRKALASLDHRGHIGKEFIEPQDEMEKKIAQIWKELLGLEKVGIRDNFFEIGGNSLKIITLNSKLSTALQMDIPIAILYQYVSIEAFVKYLTRKNNTSSEDNIVVDRASKIIKVRESRERRKERRRINSND